MACVRVISMPDSRLSLHRYLTSHPNIYGPCQVHYPQGITTGYKTFRHVHDKKKRPRDQKRYHNQWDVSVTVTWCHVM